jgi:integrase
MTVTALRSLLGFLHLRGMVGESLVGAVPSTASWRLSGLPRALEPEQVDALLGSCERESSSGQRDFAILTMLSRLGVRAGKVAALARELRGNAGEQNGARRRSLAPLQITVFAG